MDALPTKQQEVVLLRHYEDRPPREIAQRLDIPVNTVKSRLRLAHARLRTTLDTEDPAAGGWRALLPITVGLRPGEVAAHAHVGTQTAGAATAVAAGAGGLAMKKITIVVCLALLLTGGVLSVATLTSDDPVATEERAEGEVAGPHLRVTDARPETAGAEAAPAPTQPTAAQPAREFGSGGWPTTHALRDAGLLEKKLLGDGIEGLAVAGTTRLEEGGSALLWSAKAPSRFLERMSMPPDQTAQLDRGGAFRFAGLEAGGWYVGIRLADGVLRASLRQHDLPRMDPSAATRILLGAASVHGTVYDSSGHPLPGARVQVSFGPPSHKPGSLMIMRVQTDASGRYDLVRLPGGYGRISVALPGAAAFDLQKVWGRGLYLAPKERKRIDWGSPVPSATVRGVIRCGGQPAAQVGSFQECFVQFDPKEPGKPTLLAVYDDNGRFERSLPAGTYDLLVTYRRANTLHRFSAPSPTTVTLTGGRSEDLDLQLGGAQVAGRILLDGEPVRQAQVHIRWTEAGKVLTDAQPVNRGRFSFCALPPGRYEIWTRAIRLENVRVGEDKEEVRYHTRPVTVVVAEGDHRTIELILEPE